MNTDKLKITILYDNESCIKDADSDWGFSCLVEAYGRTILFDTGGSGSILLKNAEVLGVDLKTIQDVFISHVHFDHIAQYRKLMHVVLKSNSSGQTNKNTPPFIPLMGHG